VKNKGLSLFKQMMKSTVNNKLTKNDGSGNNIEVDFKLNLPAKIEEIITVNKELGFHLPKSFDKFLLNYNGGELYDYEGLDGFKIFGTKEIIKINNMISQEYEEDWIDNIVIFAECIGEGNYLGFKRQSNCDEYKVLDCFHEDLPINWETIANNFDEFLEKLVLNNGNKYWLQ